MNTYIIAFLSLHEGELTQVIVQAKSPYFALLSYLRLVDCESEYPTIDSIYSYCANADSYISVIEVA